MLVCAVGGLGWVSDFVREGGGSSCVGVAQVVRYSLCPSNSCRTFDARLLISVETWRLVDARHPQALEHLVELHRLLIVGRAVQHQFDEVFSIHTAPLIQHLWFSHQLEMLPKIQFALVKPRKHAGLGHLDVARSSFNPKS